MVKIDECLIEKEQCEDACRNVLMKSNVPLSVYTNTTSFVGVSAKVESECTCDIEEPLVCLNGGKFDFVCKEISVRNMLMFFKASGLWSFVSVS